MAGNQVLERVGLGFDYNRAAMKTPSFWLQCALIAGTVSLVGCQGAPMPEPHVVRADACRRHPDDRSGHGRLVHPDFRFRCGTVTHRISSRALIARVPT